MTRQKIERPLPRLFALRFAPATRVGEILKGMASAVETVKFVRNIKARQFRVEAVHIIGGTGWCRHCRRTPRWGR